MGKDHGRTETGRETTLPSDCRSVCDLGGRGVSGVAAAGGPFPPAFFFSETGLFVSRRACRYGLTMTERCCGALKDEVIVSGLALGIDGAAHRAALRLCRGTIGIAGCGLDRPYPAYNRDLYTELPKANLLLSEYPPQTPPLKHHFPWRNRLIAALSNRIVVMQAGFHSGTMLTVNEAIELNREVWCLPYPAMNKEGEGCNLLISQGAEILMEPSQLTRTPQERRQACKNRVKTMKF